MTPSTNSVATYGWALRHYKWLAIALAALALALAGALALRQQSAESEYEAAALVIANDLAHSPEQFPRLAEALLEKGSVAENAIRAGSLPWGSQQLREEHVTLTPLEQNILVEVNGRAESPELAATTANAVAAALVDALNRAGTGVGVFSIQDQATLPTEPVSDRSMLLFALGGLLTAILLPFGVIGLLLAVRQPVVRPEDAAEAVGVPILGVLKLPPRKVPAQAASDVPGLQALRDTLFPNDKGGWLITAPLGATAMRTSVARCLTAALAADGAVVTAPSPGANGNRDLSGSERVVLLDRPVVEVPDNTPVVIDGFDQDDVPARQTMPPGVRGLVIVPEGSPRSAAIDAAERFSDGDLAGVVFVRR